MHRTITRIFTILALLALAAAPAQAAGAADEETFRGTIASVGADSMVLLVDDKRHTVTPAPDCTITLDGEKAKLADLRAGHKATVTAKTEGGKLVASRIAASSSNQSLSFAAVLQEAKTFTGKVASLDEEKLLVTVGTKQITFEPADDCTITIDGKKAELGDLKVGYSVVVTAEQEGEKWIANRITARSEKQ